MKQRPALLNRREKPTHGVWIAVLLFIICIFLCAEFWFTMNVTPVCIDGSSMRNTLFSGDWVYAIRTATPKRGDIVIVDVRGYESVGGGPLFSRTDGEVDFIVKRLMAVEGDEIKCEDHCIYLKKAGEEDFSLLHEEYAEGYCADFPTVHVREGEIFVLGDNRAVSFDSSEVGTLHFKDIAGVVPQWSVDLRGAISTWEKFRSGLNRKISTLFL